MIHAHGSSSSTGGSTGGSSSSSSSSSSGGVSSSKLGSGSSSSNSSSRSHSSTVLPPLSPTQWLTALLQAAKGLEYCHSLSIAHRDVKLANLLLDKEGTAKLCDFGIARTVSGRSPGGSGGGGGGMGSGASGMGDGPGAVA